uniref:Uncharacterized protein n=1 Tax=Oryza nivara TaxID=4536 RepID=A0A0E0HNN9_ORYNI
MCISHWGLKFVKTALNESDIAGSNRKRGSHRPQLTVTEKDKAERGSNGQRVGFGEFKEALVLAELAIPTVKSPPRNSTSSPNPSLTSLLGRIDRAHAGVERPLAGVGPLRCRRAQGKQYNTGCTTSTGTIRECNRHAVAVLSTIQVRHNDDCRRDRATVDTGGSERGLMIDVAQHLNGSLLPDDEDELLTTGVMESNTIGIGIGIGIGIINYINNVACDLALATSSSSRMVLNHSAHPMLSGIKAYYESSHKGGIVSDVEAKASGLET